MTRHAPLQLFLLLVPFLFLLCIQNTAAEANPVIIADVGNKPQEQSDGTAAKSKSGWWVVDRSPNTSQPQDAWWTGCQNRTSDDQRNTTLANTITTQACLDWYYWGGLKDNWSGTVCNNMGFFRGAADDYKDSAACYEKCYGCLTQSIQAGAVNAICRDGHGYGVQKLLRGEEEVPNNQGPNCWIGFQPQPNTAEGGVRTQGR